MFFPFFSNLEGHCNLLGEFNDVYVLFFNQLTSVRLLGSNALADMHIWKLSERVLFTHVI